MTDIEILRCVTFQKIQKSTLLFSWLFGMLCMVTVGIFGRLTLVSTTTVDEDDGLLNQRAT
jgi:hypothetical protein